MKATMQQLSVQVVNLWNRWEVRGMVLFSLLLQVILITFGSRRRYIPRIWIRILVWSAYLLADTVATFALGILSRREGDWRETNNSIQAFWAPFLLLHLGGPDTITAYAIQDNDLWLRHLFSLLVQVGVAFYVFFSSCCSIALTFIAIPMFVSGIIKYGERTWVLRCSTTNNIKGSLFSAPPRLRLDTKQMMVVPRRHYVRTVNYLHRADYLFKMSKYLFEDLILSFTELKGGFVLELYAFLHLIFSDRAMIWLTKVKRPPANPISCDVYSLHTWFSDGKRWSGSMAQYNLVSSSLKTMKIPKCLKKFGIEEIVKYRYIKWQPTDGLKDLIFGQLLEKGNMIIVHLEDINLRCKLMDQRGDGVLEKMQLLEEFQWSTTRLEFSQSLVIWHIATDLYYYHPDHDCIKYEHNSKCQISRFLSDYMFYLLVVRPNMLPKRDACEEVKKCFSDKKEYTEMKACDACKELLGESYGELENKIATPIDTTPTIPGAYGSSKYMLLHGRMLADQLKSSKIKDQWDMISKVWIEMLGYAASHCEWKENAQQLRRGGELLTHVCLLMAHLGLSHQYREVVVS